MHKRLLTASLVAALAGCAILPRAELPDASAQPAEPPPVEKPAPAAVVGMAEDFALDLRGVAVESLFISQPQQLGEPLPNIQVQPFSVSNATLYEFMRTVLADSPLPFAIETAHPGANLARSRVTATNVSGSLKTVLDTFGKTMGFYYYYSEGTLHITPDHQYVARIPPVNELFDSLAPMLKTFGATDVLVDKTSRAITYRASRPVQDRVESYLKWVRDNRKLIVYETYIAEVVLSDEMNTGIQWNKFSWTGSAKNVPVTVGLSGGGAGDFGPGTIGIGSVFTGKHLTLDVLANFLKMQGTVNQLSRIPLMLVSGGETVFRNGGTDYYVSAISAPTVTTTGQVLQGQAQLTPLRTGIDLKLSGDLFDGTVFTQIDLTMNALTGYRSFPAGSGQTLQAPMTSDRAVNTTVRVRPGDAILIAGINYEKHQSMAAGLPGPQGTIAVAAENSKAAQRSELVIVMRPKVIQFSRGADGDKGGVL